jgi:RNA polymerase sigma-70 factor (ECF subfamily)
MQDLLYRLRSDEALMLAYQRGNAVAFECLYRRHKDGLFAFLYRSCPQRDRVEELAQEAWMGVIKAAPSYEPKARFRTWLYQIARNRLVDMWRRQPPELQLPEVPEAMAATDIDLPEHRAEQLLRAIGRLPAEQRDTLLLQQQGFSQREVAEITGVGEETVKSRLRYARNQLRTSLGDEP